MVACVAVVLALTGCNMQPTLPTYPPDAEKVYRGVPGAEANPEFMPQPENKLTYGGPFMVQLASEPVEVPWNLETVAERPSDDDQEENGEAPENGDAPGATDPPADTAAEEGEAPADQQE